ncbi:unnamed protein product [Tuber melanosporum]|uniref:(Perigord truffle) hypothetical protein n=1 Tax=Tuber melanosporum (strain Mel28) TaxID=656061 RepID=D5G3Y8_TUBMM|nr:uncharacterized protein GSTUM_00003862001 [Tuber melanosporum]CAZ79231.1 unnamed protein product [Tuber melanosporum]
MEGIALMHSQEPAECSLGAVEVTEDQTPSSSSSSISQDPRKPPSPSPSASPRTLQHTRSSSIATSAPARKRLSLSFPILPANSNISPRNASPVTNSPPGHTFRASTPGIGDITPDDPMAFLTALAAQERRVLELKEELGKAETELGKMKRQWAVHEATRKFHDVAAPIGRLRPLDTSATCDDREKIISPTREQYNARKATLNSLNGTGTRKVLPSQRHQRTLSLLSTDRNVYKQPFAQPSDLGDESPASDKPPSVRRSQTFAQTSMPLPSSVSATPRPLSMNDFSRSAGQKGQEALLRTGKQMAEDFKEGLWTFIEDLRQATVGDEGIHSSINQTGIRASTNTPQDPANLTNTTTKPPNKKSSRASLRSITPQKMSRENSKTPSTTKEMETEKLIDFSSPADEDPKSPRWSTTSTVLSEATGAITPPSPSSTPRTSTSSTTSNGGPLWSSVINTTQFNLKKTATALITSVEKSLAPLPNETATTGFYVPGNDAGHLRSRSGSPGVKNKKA